MISLKQHHKNEICKLDAQKRLEEIADANAFLAVHDPYGQYVDIELEDIPQLSEEARYEWEEEYV